MASFFSSLSTRFSTYTFENKTLTYLHQKNRSSKTTFLVSRTTNTLDVYMNAMKVSESHINVGQQFNYKWVNGLTLEYLINVYDQLSVYGGNLGLDTHRVGI